MSPRAPALPRAQRRAALVEAALTVVRRRGAVPSTREIADAAGVAEGTIFRAFATKEDLLNEAIAVAFCPAALHRQLAAVRTDLPLRDRLVAIVTVLQLRLTDMFELLAALGLAAPPKGPHRHTGCADPQRGSEGHPDADHARAIALIVRAVEPDAARLRCSPAELARYLRLLTFAGSHPRLADGPLLAPEVIVDVLLHGVLAAGSAQPERPVNDLTLTPRGPAPWASGPPTEGHTCSGD